MRICSRGSEQNYPHKIQNNIRDQLLKKTTNYGSRNDFARPSKQKEDLFYAIDDPVFSKFQRYQKEVHDTPYYKDIAGDESDLRNYLASHPDEIESGLRLEGIEYPSGGRNSKRERSVDILFIDRDGYWLVVELKASKAYDQVIGQLLRYMGWIKKHRASSNQVVRGIIIAPAISEDLKLAISMVSNADWLEHEMPRKQIIR